MDSITPTHMLSLDKDIGHSALTGLLLQVRLDLVAVVHCIELECFVDDLERVKETFGLVAVGTVGLGEDLLQYIILKHYKVRI